MHATRMIFRDERLNIDNTETKDDDFVLLNCKNLKQIC